MAVFLTLCLMLRWHVFEHEPASAAIYSISQESLSQPPAPTPVESVGKEVTSGLARARTEGTVFEQYARFEVILEAQIEQQDPVTVPVRGNISIAGKAPCPVPNVKTNFSFAILFAHISAADRIASSCVSITT